MADDEERAGRRKDGKPYKPGNTRDDGSYLHGRNRPPLVTRFAKGDGRARGKRPKGQTNLMTDWREELGSKIAVTEGGKTKKISKQRAMVKSHIDRALKRSDRAAEIGFRYAEMSEKRDPGLQADDHAIIDLWLSELSRSDSDDADDPLDDALNPGEGDDG